MSIYLCTDFEPREWDEWLPELDAVLPDEHWITRREDALAQAERIDIAVVANPPVGALQGLPRLRLIQSLWAGVDRLLGDATVPAGVPLARMVDPAMNRAMAETALWAVLSLHRGFFDYAQQQRESRWLTHGQRQADEVQVSVLGLGEMGRTTALLLARHGYTVTGWSRRPARLDIVECLHGTSGLAQALSRAEVVINLLPLTPDTRGLFNADRLATMRPGASLVNLARGAHVVEPDLLAALDAGHLRHAVLDVFSTEPLPADSPLWLHPRVTVLPHVAAQTDARSAAELVARNVHAVRAGAPLAHLVDRTAGY